MRTLGAFRIALAALVLIDMSMRVSDLVPLYTDAGLVTRQMIFEGKVPGPFLSAYLLDGGIPWAAFLFFLTFVFAGMLLVGWRTRLSTAVLWFLVYSVQQRNPYIVNYGDSVLRLLLFWGIFMPLESAWSIDRRGSGPGPQKVFTPGAIGVGIQVLSIYWFGLLAKNGADWLNGSAIFYSLHTVHYVKEPAALLMNHPSLLKIMTHSVYWFEALGPLFLLSPVFPGLLRTLAVFAFMGFHGSMGFFLQLGIFPWVDMVSLLIFLPRGFWDGLAGRFPALKARGQGVSPFISSHKDGAALLVAAYVLWLGAGGVWSRFAMPKPMKSFAVATCLEERWLMYAPQPPHYAWWYKIRAILRNGEEIDLLTEKPYVKKDRPVSSPQFRRSNRWGLYARYMFWDQSRAGAFAEHVFRDWNRRHRNDPDRQAIAYQFWFSGRGIGEGKQKRHTKMMASGRISNERDAVAMHQKLAQSG